MHSIDTYRILVHTGGHHPVLDAEENAKPVLRKQDARRWHDCGEGPWDNQQDAVDYAHAEVGLPWIVVDGAGHPVAYGDAFGLQGDNT